MMIDESNKHVLKLKLIITVKTLCDYDGSNRQMSNKKLNKKTQRNRNRQTFRQKSKRKLIKVLTQTLCSTLITINR